VEAIHREMREMREVWVPLRQRWGLARRPGDE
jgi:hypothetical protein